MKKNYIQLIAFILLSFTTLAQYPIGSTTITFNDASRTGGYGSGGGSGRQIQTEVYYPAIAAGVDASVASGVFPVITFGHGFAMSWDAYQNIWEHYVPLGYIVVFPRTEGSLFPAPSHGDFGLDLKLVDEKMQLLNSNAASPFYQKISSNSAIMGHSMGGGATILAGAGNTSIETIIGFAPAETTPSAIAAAPNVTAPAIIFSGSQDGVTPPNDNHLHIYDGLASSCKSFVSLIGGGHCYFANTNFNCDFGETTSSTGISITRSEQQTRTYSVLDPWLDYILKGNSAAYSTYLTALYATPTEIASQTTCQALAIDEMEMDFHFYPNPTNDKLTIENPTNQELSVEVYNLLGSLVLSKKVQSEVDLSVLKSGFYQLKINSTVYSIVKE
jgi:dienelactone hydrolase